MEYLNSEILKNDKLKGVYKMANKNINTRIIHKHDTETNWNKATNFIPMKGEIIVYDIDDTYNYERFKIGDGITNVNNLSFYGDNKNENANIQSDWNVNDETDLAFVKNRPFYKDGYVGTIPFIATSETTLTYTTVENDEAISVVAPYFQSVLSQADACLVKIEGNSGEISCSFSGGYFSISGFITGSWFYGSDKDWTATITDENIVLSTGNTYNVEFYDLIDPYVKIDVRYMPNEVFTTSHAPIYYGDQDGSTIQGQGTIASGFCAHAEGNQSTASGDDSHAEGYKTEASGDCSHAEGSFSKATGGNAHASGSSTVANRKAMNVIGECNIYDEVDYTKEASTTTVSLSQSSYYVAQNYSFSSSTGVFSLTNPITTNNLDSFIGWYVSPLNSTDNLSYIYYIAATTSTTNTYQVLMYKSNNKKVQRGQYVHVVGNGDSDAARSNAHTLDWSGNAWYQGNVYVGGTGQDDKEAKVLATQEYVQNYCNLPYITADNGTKIYFGTAVSNAGGDATTVEGAVTNDLFINISSWKVLKLMSTGIWVGQYDLAN